MSRIQLLEQECLELMTLAHNCQMPLFLNIDFPWLFHDQKLKIHDLSAQHIFPSKRYTTYELQPALVVTVPSARSTIVKKIKRFIIWLYKWSRVTFTELLSAVVKISRHYHHFPWLFHDFPWPLLFFSRPSDSPATYGALQMCFDLIWLIPWHSRPGKWSS